MVEDYIALYERITTVSTDVSALAGVGPINHVTNNTGVMGFPLRQDAA
jgi:hypothetical protein